MTTQSESFPARLDIDYPEKLDRFSTFFRLIWAIPILIIASLISATSQQTARRRSPRRSLWLVTLFCLSL